MLCPGTWVFLNHRCPRCPREFSPKPATRTAPPCRWGRTVCHSAAGVSWRSSRAAAAPSARSTVYISGGCGRTPAICAIRSSRVIAASARPVVPTPLPHTLPSSAVVARLGLRPSLYGDSRPSRRGGRSGMQTIFCPSPRVAGSATSTTSARSACPVIAKPRQIFVCDYVAAKGKSFNAEGAEVAMTSVALLRPLR